MTSGVGVAAQLASDNLNFLAGSAAGLGEQGAATGTEGRTLKKNERKNSGRRWAVQTREWSATTQHTHAPAVSRPRAPLRPTHERSTLRRRTALARRLLAGAQGVLLCQGGHARGALPNGTRRHACEVHVRRTARCRFRCRGAPAAPTERFALTMSRH